jgi:hypothetical protein
MVMRWPIQLQLLIPVLVIALLALGLASITSGYLGARRVRQQQDENLQRIVDTVENSAFPLEENVLLLMKGLSGAEFVLLDAHGRVEASTLAMAKGESSGGLSLMPIENAPAHVPEESVFKFKGFGYLGHRVAVTGRSHTRTGGGSLVVLYQEDQWRSAMRQAAYPALIAGGVAAVAAILFTSLLARQFVRPIRHLGLETARIAEGRFEPLAVPGRNDEIRDLALSVNAMVEKLNLYEQQVRTNERLRTLGQLGAAVAHQLRNSATGARMAIELHRRELAGGKDSEALDVALRQLRLMESYLQRFLRIGREEPLEYREVDLADVVNDVLELVRPGCVHGKIDLSYQAPAQCCAVWGNSDALRDLLMNVVLNAIEAAKRPGDVTPRVAVELERLDTGRGVIRVKDSGLGPTAAIREQLFEPFASEKPEGAGLGLFVAHRVAQAHRGAIQWQRLDDMTCFSIEIPLLGSPTNHGTPADC